MFLSYEDSVLEAADDDGNLSYAQAQRLLAEHGFTLGDLQDDDHDADFQEALNARNASALLAWLGY
jgi:hypothetical protein